jgi:hypothetical protein
MEHWWNDEWQGKSKALSEKSMPLPLSPSQSWD